HSIGTDEWRLLRQVFRPRRPVQAVRLVLCARGVNGYTLDDTGQQPQNNVVGLVWWDDVRLYEPETTATELAGRGVKAAPATGKADRVHLKNLDLGERLLGGNALTAVVVNPGAAESFALRWEFASPTGKKYSFTGEAQKVPAGGKAVLRVPY